MSRTNKIFESIPVQIPDRSGFDLSHEVLTTAKCGTVVPITTLEVVPGDTFSMGSMLKVTLPPFAVPFMGRIDAELTAAFIPNRLLWQGWQSFITQNNGINIAGSSPLSGGTNYSNVPVEVPYVQPGTSSSYVGPNTLADYLGYRVVGTVDGNPKVSALPFLAYQKFCDDWIRDENIQKPFFPKVMDFVYQTGQGGNQSAISNYNSSGRFLPFMQSAFNDVGSGSMSLSLAPVSSSSTLDALGYLPFDTSLGLGSLRQRCWSKDYFTTATTRPQAGADSTVSFEISGAADADSEVTGSGAFTIATLRAANALQKWLERNNIAGTEYGSQILAHFGVTPPDAVLNRSILLGSVRTPVVVNSVENTSGIGQEGSTGTYSPYGNVVGSAAGFGSAFDKGNLVDNFTAKEHGFIMVFFTLIPHQYYSTGIDRQLLHREVGDFAWPEFAGIGDQPIYNTELSARSLTPLGTFGYQQRYCEYKHKLDVVNGLLNASASGGLSVYALQRGFDGSSTLGSDFLEIPTTYLDDYLGVTEAVGGFGCMVDAFFDCRALRVLPEYSLPHL